MRRKRRLAHAEAYLVGLLAELLRAEDQAAVQLEAAILDADDRIVAAAQEVNDRVHPGVDRLVQHGVRRCTAAPGLHAAEADGAGGPFADAAPRPLIPLPLDRGPRLRRGWLRLPLAPPSPVPLPRPFP